MRTRRIRLSTLLLLFAALLLGGASIAPAQPAAPPPRSATPVASLMPSGPREEDRTCSKDHWVAVAVGVTTCPTVTGWDSSPLFCAERDPHGRCLPPADLPLFCSYDRSAPAARPGPAGKSPIPPARDEAVAELLSDKWRNRLKGVVPRCAVVGTSAGPGAYREMLSRELRLQVGATELPLSQGEQPGVRVAVLDTQPDGHGAPAQVCPAGSRHGFAVTHIARELTCDKGSGGTACAAQLTTRRALPLRAPDALAPPTDCGTIGSPADLAAAIFSEVSDWLHSGAVPVPPHLVLNLSVGWVPELLHPGMDGLNAEELAVYAALVYARNGGALPIAAAGNRHSGPQTGTGAVLPARWYAGPPETGGLSFPVVDEPVVWAIGGVDRNDHPLANARAGSTPPLVAYGDHATVELPGSLWTDTLTGTSVSAVVASSIAAVVWHLQPGLSASQVMARLAASAQDLGTQAELYHPWEDQTDPQIDNPSSGTERLAVRARPAPHVRRLRFAAALSYAWTLPVTAEQSILTSGSTNTLDCSNPKSVGYALHDCGKSLLWICPRTSPGPQHPICPPKDLSSIADTSWVLTQPAEDPCPNCTLSSGMPPYGGIEKPPDKNPSKGQISNASNREAPSGAQVPASWHIDLQVPAILGTNVCLSDFLIEVEVDPSAEPRRLWVDPPGGKLCGTQTLSIVHLPLTLFQGARSASISFKVEDTQDPQHRQYSARSPLYLGW